MGLRRRWTSCAVARAHALLLAGRYALLAAGAAFAVPLFLGGGAGPLLPAVLQQLLVVSVVVVARG